MRNDFFQRMLRKGLIITIALSFLLPAVSLAEEISDNTTGTSLTPSPVSEPPAKPLPEPPSLAPPASTKTSTTFRWKRNSDSERYHLQISRSKEFSEIAVDLGPIEGPRVTIGMMEEGDYFVRVSAIDEEGVEGVFSEPQSFYVGHKVPSSNIGPLMIMFGVAFMLLGL